MRRRFVRWGPGLLTGALALAGCDLVFKIEAGNAPDADLGADGRAEFDAPWDAAPDAPVAPIGSLAAGGKHTCATTLAGVRCWGSGSIGQLGLGNTGIVGDAEHPSAVALTLAGDWTALAANDAHTCALSGDGAVACWGGGSGGKLGYSSTNNIGDGETAMSEGTLPLDQPAMAIAVGSNNSCVILNNAAVQCWGSGAAGVIGNGAINDIGDNEFPSTSHVLELEAVSIAVGRAHACIVNSVGSVQCWGADGVGQLGTGDAVTPVLMATSAPSLFVTDSAVSIVAGEEHNCVLNNAGRAYCWGNADSGRIGYGLSSGNLPDIPLDPVNPGGPPYLRLTAGARHTCAVAEGGQVYCWGDGANGRLGQASTDLVLTPTLVELPEPCVAVAAGLDHTCARGTSGSVYCWGAFDGARLGYPGLTADLGDNELVDTLAPVMVE